MRQEQKCSPAPANGGLHWGQNETQSLQWTIPKAQRSQPQAPPKYWSSSYFPIPLRGRRECYSTTCTWTLIQRVELHVPFSPLLPVMKALRSWVSKSRNSLGAALRKGRAQSWQPSLPRTALLTQGAPHPQRERAGHSTQPFLGSCPTARWPWSLVSHGSEHP